MRKFAPVAMPFTITHIAAVTPAAWLLRGRLPFSAFVIGSMICDVPVFFPWLLDYDSMHSILGIFTHCVPIGLAAYFLFHSLLQRPLSTLLPRSMSIRLAPWIDREPDFSLLHISLVTACLAIGSSTHVIWDSFTHGAGWGVKLFPVLREVAVPFGALPIRWYDVLQHGSSVVFLPPLVAVALWWVYRQPIIESAKARRALDDGVVLVVLCSIVVITLAYAFGVQYRFPHANFIELLRDSVRRVGIALMVLTAVYCVVSIFTQRRQQPE